MSGMARQLLYVPTVDGWQLALHYWPPHQPVRRHPVLMVHGLAANRLNLDLDERYSVAQAAAQRGFPVYVLELRGAGLSQPPQGRSRTECEWGFGEHSQHDLPAAVSAVLAHSGADSLHGLGHSMGGMLFYSLGVTRPPVLRSITTVGSPLVCQLRLAEAERRLLAVALRLAPATPVRKVPLKPFMFAAGHFIPISGRFADGMLLNVANCEDEVMARMAREGVNDVPLKLLMELSDQMMNGHEAKGPFAYESELHRIKAPVLTVSGSVDRVAPPGSVEAASARLASHDIRYREMGKRSGDRADYGHADLLVGKRAPEEVFPVVIDFMEEVD